MIDKDFIIALTDLNSLSGRIRRDKLREFLFQKAEKEMKEYIKTKPEHNKLNGDD